MTEVPILKHLEERIEAQDRLFAAQIKAIKDAMVMELKNLPTKESIDQRLGQLEKNQAFSRGQAAMFGAISGAAVSIAVSLIIYMVSQ